MQLRQKVQEDATNTSWQLELQWPRSDLEGKPQRTNSHCATAMYQIISWVLLYIAETKRALVICLKVSS